MGVPSSSSDRAEAESKTLVSNAISLLESARRNPEGARQRRFADDKEALSKKALKKQRKEGSQAENMVHATLLSTAGSASSRKAKYARAVAQLEEARRERRNQESLYDRNVQKLSQQSMKVSMSVAVASTQSVTVSAFQVLVCMALLILEWYTVSIDQCKILLYNG
eukprot:m.126489 g.126489  ORF g.126489 m.126489 type:complete len:166 (-) comp17374_c0_seq2:750-1247(-)